MPDHVATADIESRRDIVRLVDAFYGRVRADAMLGPIFDDVAQVDWATHLPRMYDFWEAVLFGAATFKGNPLAVHRELATRTPLTDREFQRWLRLFHATIDDLFVGVMAEEARARSSRIAAVMQYHVALDSAGATAFDS
jgi:hemoglobin